MIARLRRHPVVVVALLLAVVAVGALTYAATRPDDPAPVVYDGEPWGT